MICGTLRSVCSMHDGELELVASNSIALQVFVAEFHKFFHAGNDIESQCIRLALKGTLDLVRDPICYFDMIVLRIPRICIDGAFRMIFEIQMIRCEQLRPYRKVGSPCRKMGSPETVIWKNDRWLRIFFDRVLAF